MGKSKGLDAFGNITELGGFRTGWDLSHHWGQNAEICQGLYKHLMGGLCWPTRNLPSPLGFPAGSELGVQPCDVRTDGRSRRADSVLCGAPRTLISHTNSAPTLMGFPSKNHAVTWGQELSIKEPAWVERGVRGEE